MSSIAKQAVRQLVCEKIIQEEARGEIDSQKQSERFKYSNNIY